MLNFSQKKGDTFSAVPFQINKDSSALDLTDSIIRMQLRKECGGIVYLSLTSEDDDGITITDAAAGEFEINQQLIDIEAGTYVYDIEIKFADDTVKTWISGEFLITCDITR